MTPVSGSTFLKRAQSILFGVLRGIGRTEAKQPHVELGGAQCLGRVHDDVAVLVGRAGIQDLRPKL